jgi:hypothetical protein
MILSIAEKIRVYLVVLACVLIGFTQAFWLLANHDPGQTFGTLSDAFINTFLYMLGQNVSADFAGFASEKLATVILVAFLILMMLLMLNLLIALMGDAYNEVRERGTAAWRKEQATTIIEQEYLYDNINFPSTLHVLKYSSDVAFRSNLNSEENEDLAKLRSLVEGSGIGKFTPFEEPPLNDEDGK